jgi:hypothetical protein
MAGVAAHYKPVLSRRGTRQLPAWSVQDETVVPFALRQRGAERLSQGPFPVWPHARRWSPSSGLPRLPGVGTDPPLAVMHLRSAPCATLRRRSLASSAPIMACHPRRVRIPSPCWMSPYTHPWPAVGCSHGDASCPSRGCAYPAVAVAWVYPVAWPATGHDTTRGIDTLAVAPVRPAEPPWVALQTQAAGSQRLGGRGTGPLGYQHSLGDGVGAETAFLLHVRPHSV